MILFLYFASILYFPTPTPGTQYISSLYFPFIGTQKMNLHILSKYDANLNLNGIINLTEKLRYDYNVRNGRMTFKMTDSLMKTLTEYKCSIYDAWFIDDTPIIHIFIKPIRLKKKVRFHRF
jgi:hypothetical protein